MPVIRGRGPIASERLAELVGRKTTAEWWQSQALREAASTCLASANGASERVKHKWRR